MTRSTKWLVIASIALILGGLMAHGVPLPRFVYEPALDRLRAQYPNQTLEVERVVVGVSHRPHVMISGISIDSPRQRETLKLGLLSMAINGWASIKAGQWVIDTLAIKGLDASRITGKDCNQAGLRCLPLTPAGLILAAGQQLPDSVKMDLKDLELTEMQMRTRNLTDFESLIMHVDLFSYVSNQGADNLAKLGLRLQQPTQPDNPQAAINRFSIAFSGSPKSYEDGSIGLINAQGDVTGDWRNWPWSGAVAMDAIRFTPPQTGEAGEGRNWQFAGKGLRSYLRRDDNPELHQAAFSSLEFEGGLPRDPVSFKQAEWTFTHEKAKAWTFDLTFVPSLGLVDIQPATIEGSEGEPAEAQARLLNCRSEHPSMLGLIGGGKKPVDLRKDKPYWAWHEGWFHTVNSYPGRNADLVLCPVNAAR